MIVDQLLECPQVKYKNRILFWLIVPLSDIHHFSTNGLSSNSQVQAVLGCECKWKYVSAIWSTIESLDLMFVNGANIYGLSYSIRRYLPIFNALQVLSRPWYIDHAIDDYMGHMYSLGTEFSSQRLRQ